MATSWKGVKMNINKVHCLFEQSGTFKNEFIKLGIAAEDYDIQNEFGQTDHVIDLFEEIRGGYNGEPSIFDGIEKDDLIMAFFPCTRFEAIIPLKFRGEAIDQRNWSQLRKLEYSIKLQKELTELYILLSQMVIVCLKNGIKMIIENPVTQPHYLTTYWCIKPSLIDKDRREKGDYYKKPTQYFFINCKPEYQPILESRDYVEQRIIMNAKSGGTTVKTERSMIHPQYANRFIREFILGEEFEQQEEQIMMI